MAQIITANFIALVRSRFESMDFAKVPAGQVVLPRLDSEIRIKDEILFAMRQFASLSLSTHLTHLHTDSGLVAASDTYALGIGAYPMPDDRHTDRRDDGIRFITFDDERFDPFFDGSIDTLKPLMQNIYFQSPGYHAIDRELGLVYARDDVEVKFSYIKTPEIEATTLPIDDKYTKELLELTTRALISSFSPPFVAQEQEKTEEQP